MPTFVLATDPDADRVGIAVKNDQNEFILLNGNQTGSMLINYLLTAWGRKRQAYRQKVAIHR